MELLRHGDHAVCPGRGGDDRHAARRGRFERRGGLLVLLSACAALLLRIDGFVWVAALVTPFVVWSPPGRRRELLTRVVLPFAAAFVAYHGWRLWYFGDLVPLPLYAKVLPKLRLGEALVWNDPPERYVPAFLNVYRWIPAAVVAAALALGRGRGGTVYPAAAGVVLVTAYLSVVGDWMFGFRFFVPALFLFAWLAAESFDALRQRAARLAVAALVAWIAALGWLAKEFWTTYRTQQFEESWLAAPGLDPARLFAPYFEVYEQARRHVRPGDTIAYHQAGFVPFMLGARNIDSLGICTKFYARLPTTDVVFTEVGRYQALSGAPVRGTHDTYLLLRSPRLVIDSVRHLRAANGYIPRHVIGGAYTLQFATSASAGYVPTLEPMARPAIGDFAENLAHVSRLQEAVVDGDRLDPSTYKSRLRYLYRKRARLRFDDEYAAQLTFSRTDEEVHELYVGRIRSARPASVRIALLDAAGRTVYRQSFRVKPHDGSPYRAQMEEGTRGASLALVVAPDAPGPHRVDLVDVRVQGQSAELKRYLEAAVEW